MNVGVTDPPALEARGITAGYGEVDVLTDVAIAVPARSIVSVIGPNGAGKSTLLKVLFGFLAPRRGHVSLRAGGREHDVVGARPYDLPALGMAYVPQINGVFPSLSVLENLEIGAWGKHDRRAGQRDAFEWFPELWEHRKRRAGTLSGGQRQMVAFARALMSGPEVLLLDEPSAGLAPSMIESVFERIRQIHANGVAILMVEQNAHRSLAMSTRGYVLDMGRNRLDGTGRELLDDPKVVELYLGGTERSQVMAEGSYDREAGPRGQ